MIFLLYLLAFTPLVVFRSDIFPFISGKVVFVRFILLLVSVWFFMALLKRKSFCENVAGIAGFLKKNPIVLSVFSYFFIFILSAGLAVNKFSAFFGTMGRGEGVVGMVFFLGFFVFVAILFKKKEWMWFFRCTILAGIVIFINQFLELTRGSEWQVSSIGNTIFLSLYFLFVILAGAIVYLDAYNSKNSGTFTVINFWLTISILVIILSFVGIYMASSRGVFVGLIVGLSSSLGYFIILSKKSRRLWFPLITIFLLFIGMFLWTKNSSLWQSVPLFNRLTTISISDPDASTMARFHDYKTAIISINPTTNGLKKFLLGWGPENYYVAYNTYFDSHLDVIYAPSFSDRVHNQILNVFVASGLFGLISYLMIWFFVFRLLFLGQLSNSDWDQGEYLRLILIFFGIAYFVQSLFSFDSFTNHIPFFAFLGFVVYLEADSNKSN